MAGSTNATVAVSGHCLLEGALAAVLCTLAWVAVRVNTGWPSCDLFVSCSWVVWRPRVGLGESVSDERCDLAVPATCHKCKEPLEVGHPHFTQHTQRLSHTHTPTRMHTFAVVVIHCYARCMYKLLSRLYLHALVAAVVPLTARNAATVSSFALSKSTAVYRCVSCTLCASVLQHACPSLYTVVPLYTLYSSCSTIHNTFTIPSNTGASIESQFTSDTHRTCILTAHS